MKDHQPVLEACEITIAAFKEETATPRSPIVCAWAVKFACLHGHPDAIIEYEVEDFLSNIKDWQGDDADKVRKLLKTYMEST